MLCDNCGKREANVRYSENINGKKRELNLCEECSKKLGITDFDFNMPIDFPSFFGEFMDIFNTPEIMPMFNDVKNISCNKCGYTFNDIINTGSLGCGNCYSVFEEKLNPIIRKIQGSDKHIGRIGKLVDQKIDKKVEKDKILEVKDNENKTEQENISKIEKLQLELKKAIKEERYEDAANLRDKIANEKRNNV